MQIQQKYRDDLDNQRAEFVRKQKENQEADEQVGLSVLNYQKMKDEQKLLTEDAKRNHIRQQVIEK